MITSPSIATLAKALLAFNKECPKIEKTAKNPFFGSMYAPLEEVVNKTKLVLAKNGLSVMQLPSGDKNLTTILIHESGEFIGEESSTSPAKQDPQGLGSAITYMRRYAYCSILNIATEDDDDGNTASNNHQPHYEPVKATGSHVAMSNGSDRACQSCGNNYVPKPGTESFSTVCIACYKKGKAATPKSEEFPPIDYGKVKHEEEPPF